jgi:hypothetical protein
MVRLSIDAAATTLVSERVASPTQCLKEREQPKDRLQSTN